METASALGDTPSLAVSAAATTSAAAVGAPAAADGDAAAAPPFRGPAADSALGERLIDVLGIVAAMGFACEVSHCLYLCGATYREGDKGAVNDMIVRSLERQCGAVEARAAKRGGLGMTQLIRAAKDDDLSRVLQLVQLAAPLELKDVIGRTALHVACASGLEPIAEALIDGKYEGRGAKIDAQTGAGMTPLMDACRYGQEGVVRMLLARGAEVAKCDWLGETALSWATRQGHDACAAVLRTHGATR